MVPFPRGRGRSHREIDPVGDLGVRRPELVSVDDEVAVSPLGARGQCGEVGARLRLGEALAEDQPAGRDLRNQPGAEGVGAEVDERIPNCGAGVVVRAGAAVSSLKSFSAPSGLVGPLSAMLSDRCRTHRFAVAVLR